MTQIIRLGHNFLSKERREPLTIGWTANYLAHRFSKLHFVLPFFSMCAILLAACSSSLTLSELLNGTR